MQTFFDGIVDTQTLFRHLENPGWIIFDCRFDLANPSWGEEEYRRSHIPGAIYAHLDRYLSGIHSPHSGRHPLPEVDFLVSKFSNWGIQSGKQVIVYDSSGGSFAVRLWWLLKYLGHDRVAVLDGGYAKWKEEALPTTDVVVTNPPAEFHPNIRPWMLATAAEVEEIRTDPNFVLIDARANPRFLGIEEPIDAIAGHIPGAVNRFHGNNLTPQGVFLEPDELRRQFLAITEGKPARQVVVYCGSGVTSCHHVLAMQLAGLGIPRLYAGSWSEWIKDPSRPIATAAS